MLYQGITKGRGSTTAYIKEQWEKELKDKITQRTMQCILGHQIPLTCTTLYLGDLPEGITGNNRYLLKILTTAAKKVISRK